MRVVVRVNMSSITKSPHQEFKLCPWIFDQVQQRDLAKLINSKSNNFTVKKQSVFRLHTSSKTWIVGAEAIFFFFGLTILNLTLTLYWGIVTYNVGLVSGVQQSGSVIHVWDYHWLSTNYMPGSLLDLHKDNFVSPLPRIPWDALKPSSRDQETARVRTNGSEPWHTFMHNALELGKINHY